MCFDIELTIVIERYLRVMFRLWSLSDCAQSQVVSYRFLSPMLRNCVPLGANVDFMLVCKRVMSQVHAILLHVDLILE